MSERINYTISNGLYCWHSVNMPFGGESLGLEEMQKDVKALAKIWLDDVKETVEKGSFDFVEETS